jgi:hypothetical protein
MVPVLKQKYGTGTKTKKYDTKTKNTVPVLKTKQQNTVPVLKTKKQNTVPVLKQKIRYRY